MKIFSKLGKIIYEHKALFIMLIIGYSLCIKRTTPYIVGDEYRFTSGECIEVGVGETYTTSIDFTGKKYMGINLLVENARDVAGATYEVVDSETDECIASADLEQHTDYKENDALAEYLMDSYVSVTPGKEYRLQIVNGSSEPVICKCNDIGKLWVRPLYLLYSMPVRILLNILFISVSICGIYAVLFLVPKCKDIFTEPENVFLLGTIVMGLLYLFVVPAFKAPDTLNQYVRTYSITKGYFLIPRGGIISVPWNLGPFEEHMYSPYVLLHNFKMSIDKSHMIEHDAVNMALYSPLSYLLQAFGVGVADIFSNNTYVLLYAGTVASMIGCNVLLYYSIKFVPYGKWVLAYISLLPMAVQQRSSISVDAITYAAVVAMCSFVLYWRYEEKKMSNRALACMYVIVALTASCKIVYFIAAGLVLFIPSSAFKQGKAWLHKTIAMIELAVMSFGWFMVARSYLGTTRGGEDMAAKLDIILHSPFRYVYICCKMLWENGGDYLLEMIGKLMGSTDIEMSVLLMIVALVFLLRLYFEDKEKRIYPDAGVEAFTLLQSFGMLLLVFTSLYLQWTVISAAVYSIEGIQGRYMLPIAPVLMLGLLARKKSNADGEGNIKTGAKPMFILLSIDAIVAMLIFGYISYLG